MKNIGDLLEISTNYWSKILDFNQKSNTVEDYFLVV